MRDHHSSDFAIMKKGARKLKNFKDYKRNKHDTLARQA
jgi:hypothetical protein